MLEESQCHPDHLAAAPRVRDRDTAQATLGSSKEPSCTASEISLPVIKGEYVILPYPGLETSMAGELEGFKGTW